MVLGGDLLPRKGHHSSSLEIQQAYVQNEFRDFTARVRRDTGAPVCAILGNDDWAGTIPLFRLLEQEGVFRMLGDVPFIPDGRTALYGYSFVPPTPFLLKDFEKRDLAEDPSPGGLRRIYVTRDGAVEEADERSFFSQRASIEEDLQGSGWRGEGERSVFVMHGPPFGTALDRLYDGRSAGSRAVHGFLSERQPVLALHGHIHESPAVSGSYAERINATLAVNPGQTGDQLSAVVFDLDDPPGTIKHTVHGALRRHKTDGRMR
jgi:Icc-related predicted phosphoesterase